MRKSKILLKSVFIGGVTLVVIPSILLVACNCTPGFPKITYYNIDGSDWQGRTDGTLSFILNETNHTVSYTGNIGYVANDLIIPEWVKDVNGVKYNVTEIGENFFNNFYGVPSLTGSLTIGNSVRSIGRTAFYKCSEIEHLIIGNNVQSIGNSAFGDCSGLTSDLIIPDNVVIIQSLAFTGCTGLNGNLTLSNYSLSEIGSDAFSRCQNISQLKFLNFDSQPTWTGINIFTGWNANGTVSTSGGTWSATDALAYAKTKNLPATWTT